VKLSFTSSSFSKLLFQEASPLACPLLPTQRGPYDELTGVSKRTVTIKSGSVLGSGHPTHQEAEKRRNQLMFAL